MARMAVFLLEEGIAAFLLKSSVLNYAFFPGNRDGFVARMQ